MWSAVVFLLVATVAALDNGLGRRPQMGWNSWNHFACGINETLIRHVADDMVGTGLLDAGYEYVNMDDCWAYDRDANGYIQPDPRTFPSGIRVLADYVHARSLKFGLYSDAGYYTCAGRPGSLGHEVKDAEQYANWTVDYLKYDNCYAWDATPAHERYPPMRDALNKTGRPIFFSMCDWGNDEVATWARDVGNSWRTTEDIKDYWFMVTSRLDSNDKWAKYAGPGGWNDPDMLEVGNGRLTLDEEQAHFALWCLVKAPLLIGCDVGNMSNDTHSILTNAELIAVNQDDLGVQARKLVRKNELEVWGGQLSGGAYAVALFNRSPSASNITANWSDLGIPAATPMRVRDLWLHEDVGVRSGSVSALVRSHAAVIFKLSP
eukprot:TRINITY_DN11668_c0_g1_i1.p1 TRINITY_DN11668_c0_g1~~TRINITY_DN11668_c0_g1_i1.p1  ORF type:complete len:377 (-),score=132.12 TRINITY_DN11668_c0_g1_i1:89-1219(-)